MTRLARFEMSRPIRIDRIPAGGSNEEVVADAGELRALETRFALPVIHSLRATLDLACWRGSGVKVTGMAVADIEQVCVVSLERFRSELQEPVERYFVPRLALAGASAAAVDQAEIDIIDQGVIDIGEMVSEIVALAIDPYPKRTAIAFVRPDELEDAPQAAASVTAFASLAALKKGRN